MAWKQPGECPVAYGHGQPGALDITLSVNGSVRQSGNTADLIVGVPEMIELASSVMTLCPGDTIATGTPAGVGPLVVGGFADHGNVTATADDLGYVLERHTFLRDRVKSAPATAFSSPSR